MKKLILIWVILLPAVAVAQPFNREDHRPKVIIDNDLCGDPDGLFALAHHVLCGSCNIRGIVGAHLGSMQGYLAQGDQAEASVHQAEQLLELMGMTGNFSVVKGASSAMTSPSEPMDSPGARLIIDEARQCTPERPLYVCMGGPLTDVASALLLAPEITSNIIVVWIGGQEYPFSHPKPWGGISEVEYNLNLSIPAARMLFNDSDVRLWQVTRDCYRSCLYSFASLDRWIAPLGETGKFLCDELSKWRRFGGTTECYVLGDSPLVLLTAMQTFFEPDTASSDFVETAAPFITEEGQYDFTRPGRTIRVYTRLDTALMFKDMEDRFALHAGQKQ